jgi:hypothetical protein
MVIFAFIVSRMCDGIQSAVIHSSTAQWELGGGGEVWVPPAYQGAHHPTTALWEAQHAHHQYQPDLFGFGPEFWARQAAAPTTAHHTR